MRTLIFKIKKWLVRVFTVEQHYLRMMRQGNHFFSRQILHEQSKEQNEYVTTRNDDSL
jgi:hypothetical protein